MLRVIRFTVPLVLGVICGVALVVACGGGPEAPLAQTSPDGGSTGGDGAVCGTCTLSGPVQLAQPVRMVTAENDAAQLVTMSVTAKADASLCSAPLICAKVAEGPLVVTGIYGSGHPVTAMSLRASGEEAWVIELLEASGGTEVAKNFSGLRLYVAAGETLVVSVFETSPMSVAVTGFRPY